MARLREGAESSSNTSLLREIREILGDPPKEFKPLGSLEIGSKRTFFLIPKDGSDHIRVEAIVVDKVTVDKKIDTSLLALGQVPIRDVEDPVLHVTVFIPDGTEQIFEHVRITDLARFTIAPWEKPTRKDWDRWHANISARYGGDEEEEEDMGMLTPPPPGKFGKPVALMPGGLEMIDMLPYEGSIDEVFRAWLLPVGKKPSRKKQEMARALCIDLKAGGADEGVPQYVTLVRRRVKEALED